jgi:DNA-binding NarL/FixJ family response regulator
MIRLVIADDHAVLRQGLSSLLASHDDMEVVGEAGDGLSAVAMARETRPDVIVLDISMPGLGMLQMLKRLRLETPEVKILILSTHPEEQYAIRALRAGADGYLTKERTGDELAIAVRHVASGRKFVSPQLAEHLANELAGGKSRGTHEDLSDREFQVFLRLGRGLSIKETAAELSLSPKTVHTYRSRIFEKTGLKNDAEIVRYVVKNGLID